VSGRYFIGVNAYGEAAPVFWQKFTTFGGNSVCIFRVALAQIVYILFDELYYPDA
jgi:hypothetical protein